MRVFKIVGSVFVLVILVGCLTGAIRSGAVHSSHAFLKHTFTTTVKNTTVGQTINWGSGIENTSPSTVIMQQALLENDSSTDAPLGSGSLVNEAITDHNSGLVGVCVGWPPCNGYKWGTTPHPNNFAFKGNTIGNIMLSFVIQTPGVYQFELVLQYKLTGMPGGSFADPFFGAPLVTEHTQQFLNICVSEKTRKCNALLSTLPIH